MPAHDWEERYAQDCLPWDTAGPDPSLVDFVSHRLPASLADRRVRGTHPTLGWRGKALDVGCGTGTHALWLAEQGFDVLGVDISTRAIARARARAADARPSGPIRFEVLDFLSQQPDGGPFDFVFDRGVFHVFDAPDDRDRFAAQVARCLAPSGVWVSLIGSTEGPPREEGPPRRSARDIANAIEPVLEIVELGPAAFDRDAPMPKQAWRCVARVRTHPAQPSTTRG